jgi:hypothetical protein
MTLGRFRSFFHMISGVCFVAAFGVLSSSSVAQAERILDLRFWSSGPSALALGGLWEFHAQTLLEPAQRHRGSELLLEISQPWRNFQPLMPNGQGPLQRGSYVLLVKGFTPRPEGYALRIASPQSMTRMIVAPKYAPGLALRVQTEGVFAVFPMLRLLIGPRLNVVFKPRSPDETWLIIVQRWQTALDTQGSIPRLQFAEKMD